MSTSLPCSTWCENCYFSAKTDYKLFFPQFQLQSIIEFIEREDVAKWNTLSMAKVNRHTMIVAYLWSLQLTQMIRIMNFFGCRDNFQEVWGSTAPFWMGKSLSRRVWRRAVLQVEIFRRADETPFILVNNERNCIYYNRLTGNTLSLTENIVLECKNTAKRTTHAVVSHYELIHTWLSGSMTIVLLNCVVSSPDLESCLHSDNLGTSWS